MRKRRATSYSALPPKCRKTTGAEMEIEKEPRIPPVILDIPKGWASHAVTLRQLLGGDLEAVCTARTLRLKTTSVAHFRSLQRYLHGAQWSIWPKNLAKKHESYPVPVTASQVLYSRELDVILLY
ncbi:hypothetical protein J6590_093794 [Homalodisca vitripennis]|nr:hypothetical protein J6590_093794 [Homalodisca vitripennis]